MSARAVSDRNLLFGMLALQMDFITRDQILAAMHAWVADKTRTLGAILIEQGALRVGRHVLLDALMQEHLKQHDNDAEKSLQAVSSIGSVRQQLQEIADPDVQASLKIATVLPSAADPYATRPIAAAETPALGPRFRILRPHAKGGLGEVYVARDQELGREVALKQIQGQYAADGDSRTRFVLEAEVTGGLEHPGIVPVYGLGRYEDGRPFYAMRFIKGDSLKEAIEQFHRGADKDRTAGARNLELRQLLGRFIDVCHAIAYAHHRGILHRDLKPGNVMLGQYGETLVVDWGLAKIMGKVDTVETRSTPLTAPLVPASFSDSTPTEMGSTLGTPGFMSPEQAGGQHALIGPATDIYSLGATLYCLLTGRPPFIGKDVRVMLAQAERNQFPLPRTIAPDVPRALEAICLKAMARWPQERYASAGRLAADVEHWLADEPTEAWPEPWPVRAGRWLRRHRTATLSAVSAVSAAAVILACATVLLTAANERERLAKEEALTQQAIAEANFKLARQAVDRYHTEVSEETLLDEPAMEPLRKKLLEAAREFYDRFVKERGDDPQLRGELGRALFRLGQISGAIDTPARGIEAHRRGVDILRALGPEYRVDTARAYHHMGRLHRLDEQLVEAAQAYQQALEIWPALVAADRQYEMEQARTQFGLGNVYNALRRFEPARKQYEQALATLTQLSRARPEDAAQRREVAVVQSNLATLLAKAAGKGQQALTAAAEARAVQEKLAQDRPAVSKYRDDLARTLYVLGACYTERPETLDEAKGQAELETAVALREKLVTEHPDVVSYRSNLARVYLALAGSRRAEPLARKGLALHQQLADKNPGSAHLQRDLALAHLTMGSLHARSGNVAAATTAYGMARAILENLLARAGLPPHYQADSALVERHLCQFYVGQGQLDRAEEAATTALARLEALERQHADVMHYPEEVAILHDLRARVRMRQALYAQAASDWNAAIARSSGSDQLWYRLYRSEALARGGSCVLALAEAGQLTQVAGSHGKALFQLARIHAIAAATDERAELRDGSASRAVELLVRAGAAGFFRNPSNLKMLEDDPHLQALRERSDFRDWWREVARAA